MKIAVVGATGMVGQTMLKVMEEISFPCEVLIPVASAASVGKIIHFKNNVISIQSIETCLSQKPDIALFSAGGETSANWAPKFAANGTYVIDNSSAWRMKEGVPLVVPEVNPESLQSGRYLIANPNCSTIQMVVALAPIHRAFGIKRLVISTYQSVTGSGSKGLKQLENEQKGAKVADAAYPHPIHMNLIPHGGPFDDKFYTTEERKLERETRKILNDPAIAITATVVRVPVTGGHSMSVNIETCRPFEIAQINQMMASSPGIVVVDEPFANKYPMPLYAADKDGVFVGRIRRDESIANGLNMWIVADNLRKGAATNAIQIASLLIKNIFTDPKQK